MPVKKKASNTLKYTTFKVVLTVTTAGEATERQVGKALGAMDTVDGLLIRKAIISGLK